MTKWIRHCDNLDCNDIQCFEETKTTVVELRPSHKKSSEIETNVSKCSAS